MKRRLRRTRALPIAAITVIGIGGCGSAAHHTRKADPPTRLAIDGTAKPQPGGSTQTGGVVALVGGTPIMKSALDSRMAMEVHGEAPGEDIVPVPPDFSACVARLASLAKPGAGAATPERDLKNRCRQRYQKLMSKVLGTLISDEWAIGGAREQGVAVSDSEARARLEHLKAVQFGSEAKFQTFLKHTGENIPDLLFNIQADLAATALRRRITASVKPVTPARAAQYYAQNKRRFDVAEQRDLGILRTRSMGTARQIKQELNSGVSFATIATRLAKEQPVYTARSHGLLVGLEPHVFHERVLNDAIFSAKPHVVTGPVKLNLGPHFDFRSRADIQSINGYYVFEVQKVTPPHEMPFAEAKTAISQQLPGILERRALAPFIESWRARWRAKTNCRPGYVVRKCREFRAARSEKPEDPYTLS